MTDICYHLTQILAHVVKWYRHSSGFIFSFIKVLVCRIARKLKFSRLFYDTVDLGDRLCDCKSEYCTDNYGKYHCKSSSSEYLFCKLSGFFLQFSFWCRKDKFHAIFQCLIIHDLIFSLISIGNGSLLRLLISKRIHYWLQSAVCIRKITSNLKIFVIHDLTRFIDKETITTVKYT